MGMAKRWVIFAVASLVLAGGTFTGVALATPSPSGQQYTGCLQYGFLYNVAIGTSPLHACPNHATQITWNQAGQPTGSSNTTLYTWTVTLPAQAASAGGYAQVAGTTVIPVGSTVVPISGEVITGDLSSCAVSGYPGLDGIDVSSPSSDPQAAQTQLAGTSGLQTNHSGTALGIDSSRFVAVAGPLVVGVYCNGSTFESGPGGATPAVTVTFMFAVTTPPSGPAQTYT